MDRKQTIEYPFGLQDPETTIHYYHVDESSSSDGDEAMEEVVEEEEIIMIDESSTTDGDEASEEVVEEEEEEINMGDNYPVLTFEDHQILERAKHRLDDDDIITKFKLTIKGLDIKTLISPNWLNDNVINFYMQLLQERSKDIRHAEAGWPAVYPMNTFFTRALARGGYDHVKKWTKNDDIFKYDLILIPVHVNNVHWAMAIVDTLLKTIKYYDSLDGDDNGFLDDLGEYLKSEWFDKRRTEFDTSEWTTENVFNHPRQENGFDCGVFCCMTAEFISRFQPITFKQRHMFYFRQKMIVEIVKGKMLQ